jgi:hypothetical protein
VLLIVRPSGSKYFAARQMLQALDRPFGYELVEENLPIAVPPVDPIAAELCRSAVESVIKDRDDLKKLLVSHGPEILSRNPNYRVKRKPEGGFEVEYAPDGRFADEGLEGNAGPRRIGDPEGGPFGAPPPSPSHLPPGHGVFGEPGTPGDAGSSAVTQAPHFTGDAPSPGQGEKLFSDPPDSPLFGQGEGPGSTRPDPRQPRLLPEEILRRSQGQVPYHAGSDSFVPPAPTSAPFDEEAGQPNGTGNSGTDSTGSEEAGTNGQE